MMFKDLNTPYENIAQRMANIHLRLMAPLAGNIPGNPADDEARRQLHGFFTALYEAIYECPQAFGLPVTQDFYVNWDGPDGTRDKSLVTAKFKPVRDGFEHGLDLLAELGLHGEVEGQTLLVETAWLNELLKQARSTKKFLAGLQTAGLMTETQGEKTILRSLRFPVLFPALKSLAQACSQLDCRDINRFYFARCDFGVLTAGYQVAIEDLYRVANPDEQEGILQMHRYYLERGYKTEVDLYGMRGWSVKYQGSRKVKGTPLFEVSFQDREKAPVMVQIKCASANRIIDRIPGQSAALQADFRRRVNSCAADKCNWCKDKKGLGPSVLEYQGEKVRICWYVNGGIRPFDDRATELVKEYTEMHESLAA